MEYQTVWDVLERVSKGEQLASGDVDPSLVGDWRDCQSRELLSEDHSLLYQELRFLIGNPGDGLVHRAPRLPAWYTSTNAVRVLSIVHS